MRERAPVDRLGAACRIEHRRERRRALAGGAGARRQRAAANAYARRLQLYRGLIRPDELLTPADTADVQVATLSYGLGNWYLVRGDTARAREAFDRAIRSGAWPAFGFIVAERELARMRLPVRKDPENQTPAPRPRS